MNDLTGLVGAGAGGVLVAVVVAFLRSVLLAQKATVEQQEGWRSIIEEKDRDRDRLARENDALRDRIATLTAEGVTAQAEIYQLRRRLAGGNDA